MKSFSNNMYRALYILMMFIIIQIQLISQGSELVKTSIEGLVSNITSHKSLAFDFKHYGTNVLKSIFPETIGAVTILTGEDSVPGNYSSLILNAKTTSSNDPKLIELSIMEGMTFKIDHEEKAILRSPEYRNGVAMFNHQYIMPVIALEEISKAPIDGAKYIETVEVNGMSCLKIEYKAESINYIYYIGEEDHWMYKMEASKPHTWGDAAIVAEFNHIKWDPEITKNTFLLEAPKEYVSKEYVGKFPPIGSDAPDFEITPHNGEAFMLSDLKGKVVILDFWATWCGPCILSMKHLQEVHEEYGDKVVIIGLNWQDTKDPLPFIEKKGYTYIFSSENGAADLYKANLPLAIVIDQNGILVDFYNGYFGEESDKRLDDQIMRLINDN